MKPIEWTLAACLLTAEISEALSQERPSPGPAPNYIPAPPPSLGEIPPFPSNTDNQIALVAHLYDPENKTLIISVDTQSNQNFVLQKSSDLKTWAPAQEPKQGNKSIITFVVALDEDAQHAFFRVIKRSPE